MSLDRRVHPGGLAIWMSRKLNSTDVLEVLADVLTRRGTPQYILSGNDPYA